jgi:hypothetical protein
VSITVDPEHDTSARLAEFAKGFRASPRMWSFLTGDTKKLARVDPKNVMLVDQQMRVRGYYDPSDKAGEDRLVAAIGLLVNRGE